MGLSSGKFLHKTKIDTYTSTGIGTTADVSTVPLSNFTLLVTTTGTVTSWIVILEGSIDGINFSTMATHTNLVGANISVFPGVNKSPCLYFRTRCTALLLGLGINITATVLGSQ